MEIFALKASILKIDPLTRACVFHVTSANCSNSSFSCSFVFTFASANDSL